ncbi:hypothetical protein [Rhizobium sp. AP16]|uniref:hypothetical protein n=1 Tax=Rhizobium sp. AP16 TaxID=1144306 RepID=UPI00026ED2CE|nr:hypothetical protein [Rhizobium sp. AP16]EJK79476.1 hypothetical protein PMI03_05575 [Rhizobium sp. AP16]
MAVSYPYSLPAFADLLKISSIVWDIQRNDELSGSGDGRVWQAELAPPLWIGTVTLADMYNVEAKQIAARIRKLHGAQEALFLYDPLSKYPQADPDGTKLGAASVSVAALGADNASLSLKGLPAGYRLIVGDKMQVGYGGRYAFLEVSETVAANGAGTTPVFGVFPHLPAGFSAGLSVVLLLPACKCIIMPGSHNPGTASGLITTDATFKIVQKK